MGAVANDWYAGLIYKPLLPRVYVRFRALIYQENTAGAGSRDESDAGGKLRGKTTGGAARRIPGEEREEWG